MKNSLKGALLGGAIVASMAGAQAQTLGNLAEQAAQSYREQARYPAWSQPLARDGLNPIVSEREPAVISVGGDGGPRLSFWSDDSRYEPGDVVHISAKLDQGSVLQGEGGTDWAVRAELLEGPSAVLAELPLKDDGKGADQRAGDGVYSAQLLLDQRWQPELGKAKNMGLRVSADNGKDSLRSMGGFLYSRPAAALTGQYRDVVKDGNLLVQAKVEVAQAGRFHLSGVLASLDASPLAFAQQSYELEAGQHWVDLAFYGLILRELGAALPLQLQSVTLSTVGTMPNALGPVASNVLTTRAYLPSVFTAKPFGREDLLDMAQRLEAGL